MEYILRKSNYFEALTILKWIFMYMFVFMSSEKRDRKIYGFVEVKGR